MKDFKSFNETYYRLNESENRSTLYSNIEDAFQNLIDDGHATIKTDYDVNKVQWIHLYVDVPEEPNSTFSMDNTTKDFSEVLNISKIRYSRLNEINESLTLLKDINQNEVRYSYWSNNEGGKNEYQFMIYEKL
jgi:hypothetical protein